MSVKPKFQFYFLLMIFLLSFTVVSSAFSDDPVVITSGDSEPFIKPDGTGIIDQVMREAFRRIGREFILKWEPQKRARKSANAGKADGTYGGVREILESYPDLIVVPSPYYRTTYVAVSKHPNIEINGWSSLKPYTVGYPMGWKIFKNKENHFGHAFPVSEIPSLLKMADQGRIDIILIERTVFRSHAEREGIDQLHILAPPIDTKELYLFLHKKNLHMQSQLAAALDEMSEDGTLKQICLICAESLAD
ncbi:substrate-binding periplasmic protein [Kiloniella sp.]|uniref:substrate-binding periplasmic protein n=1 Tax=Kiloniella sp. TaxID=1938587 RepID=UPI003B023C6B